jgi:hypothetical protein
MMVKARGWSQKMGAGGCFNNVYTTGLGWMGGAQPPVSVEANRSDAKAVTLANANQLVDHQQLRTSSTTRRSTPPESTFRASPTRHYHHTL